MLLVSAGLMLGVSSQEDKNASGTTGKAVLPRTGPVDTLSVAGGGGALGGEPVLVATSELKSGPVTGPIETISGGEAKVASQDPRYSLQGAAVAKSGPTLPRLSMAKAPASAVSAVAPATGSVSPTAASVLAAAAGSKVEVDLPKVPNRSTEELVKQIEDLRSGFYDQPEPRKPEDADSGAAKAAPSKLSALGGGVKKSAPVEEVEPFASATPVRSRPSIGQQVSARTMASGLRNELGVGGGHSASQAEIVEVKPQLGVPAKSRPKSDYATGEVEIARYPTAPFADVAAAAAPPGSPERKGLLGRLFGKKPSREEREAELAAQARQSSVEEFPQPKMPATKASKDEDGAQGMIDRIYHEYTLRVNKVTASDLVEVGNNKMPTVPGHFESVWLDRVKGNYFKGEEPLAMRLEEVYARALMHSNRVKVYGYDPLIRETGIQEAEGMFDLEAFTTATYGHTDEPTSTTLETGEIGRFLENKGNAEAGFRRRFATGGQISLSNRFMTLDSNSEFLSPNPQTESALVLSVVQPLLKGSGYHYNKARLKVAKIDAGMAAAEYVARLEGHLLEVNRAYWDVYLYRAAFLLRRSLVVQTGEILANLEARADEATASELLRARSEMSRRRTAVNRAEMSVRNAEEKLRSLVNDPEFPIGGPGELVPVTAPILSAPRETVQSAALEAVDNRAEMAHSFGQLRTAAIRNYAGRHELMPQLDLIAESRMTGLDANRRVAGAYDDMLGNDASWLAGVQFSHPLENNSAEARRERLRYEVYKQEELVRDTMDTILLESVVTYRELMAVYRDMQGNYQQVLSTREELRGLKERLDVDANNDQTVSFRLQNVMDALERSQLAEEQFLFSVVAYNKAFAQLEQAKGTFLKYQDVSIEREPSPRGKKMEVLRPVSVGSGGSSSGAK